MTDIPTLYKGEGILLRWNESSNGGRTVTFALADTPDDSAAHPFKGIRDGKTGQRVGLVVVALAEDQHDPPTAKPGPVTAPAGGRKLKDMSHSQRAWNRCADPRFQAWLGVGNEGYAADYVRKACGVKSRSELDTNEEAATAWLQIENGFMEAAGLIAERRGRAG